MKMTGMDAVRGSALRREQTAKPRHHDVEEDKVGKLGPDGVHRHLAVGQGHDLVAFRLQDPGEQDEIFLRVIDHHDHGFSDLVPHLAPLGRPFHVGTRST